MDKTIIETNDINEINEIVEPAGAAEAPAPETETVRDDNPDNVFFNSLADMTANDIELNEVAKAVKKPSVDFMRYFMLSLSLGLLLCSGYFLAEKIFSYISAAREYDALQSIFYDGEEDGDGYDSQIMKQTKNNKPIEDIFTLQTQGVQAVETEDSEVTVSIEKKQLNTKKIMDINPDYYGWLRVDYTKINYPVVQTWDNDYYLRYTFEKSRNKSGAIFADFNNSRNISDNRNLIIYGHNMLDGSMFQPLITEYSKREDHFKNGYIELVAPDSTTYYYEIFSVRDEDPSSGYIQTDFASDEEYVEFLSAMKERSYFQKDVILDADSKIITLSTCVNDTTVDWRFVVQGVLVEIK